MRLRDIADSLGLVKLIVGSIAVLFLAGFAVSEYAGRLEARVVAAETDQRLLREDMRQIKQQLIELAIRIGAPIVIPR